MGQRAIEQVYSAVEGLRRRSARVRLAGCGLASAVLATIIIRYSSHPSVVMMKPIQYRKCDDLSSTIGGAGVSS